jgi:hypothetical protein
MAYPTGNNAIAAPIDLVNNAPIDFGKPLHDAAGFFVQHLMATAQQLNSKIEIDQQKKLDQIDETLKELFRVIDTKADQTELDALTVKVKNQETTEIVRKMTEMDEEIKTLEKVMAKDEAHQTTVQRVEKLEQDTARDAKQLFETLELKAFQKELEQVTADIVAVVATKATQKDHLQEVKRIDQIFEEFSSQVNATLNHHANTKADHQTALDLIATLRVKANQQDLEELAVRVSAEEEKMNLANAAIDTKADHGGVLENSASLKARCEAISTALDKKAEEIHDQIDDIRKSTEEGLKEVDTKKADRTEVEEVDKKADKLADKKADTTKVEEVDKKADEISVALNNMAVTKASREEFQAISTRVGAKADKQEIRRHHRVVAVNTWRCGQKLFQQAAGCVVNDYRATMVMDIGFRYKMALQVTDHNRNAGPIVEAAVALLPESSSAWMNCDWGTGKGWPTTGNFPGVGLMNLHGQQKTHILTSGDILDIALDHNTGQHVVEFRKRGSDVHCRRRVAPLPVNLVMSMWGRAGLELIEFDVVTD